MRIKFISPINHTTPLLFETMVDTFIKQGHSIVEDINEATVIFFDMYSNMAEYNMAECEIVIRKQLPVISFDATDFGAMSKERWFGFNIGYANVGVRANGFMLMAFMVCKVVYFMRKMDKTLTYPKWVYPYECIMYPDHIFEPTTKEELYNRPFDICFIGNTSPTRENLCNALAPHFKCDFVLGQERIEHNEWLNRHRQSKLFLEACGGGFGSERPYQLISISPMLKVKNDQLILNDFDDSVSCIKISEHPTQYEIELLKLYLQDKDILYSIYRKGIEHMTTFYNAQYRSNYILKALKKHGIN